MRKSFVLIVAGAMLSAGLAAASPAKTTREASLLTGAIWTDDATSFAAQELQKYLRLATGRDWPLAGAPEQAAIVLVLAPAAGNAQVSDQFRIVTAGGRVTITGVNRRSVLYGVYAFLERELGAWFFAPGQDVVSLGQTLRIPATHAYGETARFRLRQIRLEWSAGEPIVDWVAKNRFNSVSMDFRLWDTPPGQAMRRAAAARGLELGGSGHAMYYLLPADRYFAAHPEWFPEVAGKRVATRNTGDNFCYSNPLAREELVRNMQAFCTAHPYLKQINLWPGDGGAICHCAECRQHSFMELYGGVVAAIRQGLAVTHPDLQVGQLAYNFDGKDKLRLEAMRVPSRNPEIPTMFAFWGQNLSIPLANNPEPGHRAALAHLTEFARRAPGQAAIFSYHTDTYMNSELCPVFTTAMAADFKLFKKLGVEEVCLLWIPWHERCDKITEWVAFQNGALWGRLAMDGRLSATAYRRDYCRAAYGPDLAARAEAWWNELSRCLGTLSALTFPWQPASPSRPYDAWGLAFDRNAVIWKPETANAPQEALRRQVFATAAKELARLRTATAGVTAADYPEWSRFQNYIARCAVRTAGLSCLFEAQAAIVAGNRPAAQRWLEQALATGMVEERTQTEAWLRTMKGQDGAPGK